MYKEIIKVFFENIWELILLFISIIIPIYLSFFPSNISNIDTKNWIIATFSLIIVILVAIKLYIITLVVVCKNRMTLPKLKYIRDKKYIFEASDLFSINSYVTVYYIDVEQEKLAMGVVDTIIDNTRNIQVRLIGKIKQATKDKISQQRNKIFIKPTITNKEVDENTIQTGDNNE